MLKYLIGILAITSVSSASIVAIQYIKIRKLSDENHNLENTVISLKEGAIIQEQLRLKNSILESQVSDLVKEIENAESKDVPLPDDIRDILNRMPRTRNPE